MREKLLRPAGYSLGKRLEGLWEKTSNSLFWGFLCALVAAGGLVVPGFDAEGQLAWAVVLSARAAGCTVAGWRSGQLRALTLIDGEAIRINEGMDFSLCKLMIFRHCCVPNRITPQWQSSARSVRTSPGI